MLSAREPLPALPADEDVVVGFILSSSALIVLRLHLTFKKTFSAIFVLCCGEGPSGGWSLVLFIESTTALNGGAEFDRS